LGEPLPDVPLCRGWRAKAVLPELLAILSGETAIRVADARSKDPLELVELEPEEDEGSEPLDGPGGNDAGPPSDEAPPSAPRGGAV
ncbi:MAG: hypothetical protein ACKODX_05255, partial [Gemmata sp.]